MNLKPVLRGISSYLPGQNRVPHVVEVNARYCYSVWLRHLILASKYGLKFPPGIVAELGPGEFFGVGIAALLSGSHHYYAFDVVKYASYTRNMEALEEMIELFRTRHKLPDETEWPLLKPKLDSYDFPGQILTDEWLEQCLQPERIEAIKQALFNLDHSENREIHISYAVPWYYPDKIREKNGGYDNIPGCNGAY